jgi:hypothetical protein
MRGASAALVLLFVVACCGGGTHSTDPSVQSQSIGQAVPFRLLTHCGVRYADFDGRRFYADPPLDDGNGNPPVGWANPYDEGTMKLIDDYMAVFTDQAGNRAAFSTHPDSGIPAIQVCS